MGPGFPEYCYESLLTEAPSPSQRAKANKSSHKSRSQRRCACVTAPPPNQSCPLRLRLFLSTLKIYCGGQGALKSYGADLAFKGGGTAK